MKNHGSAQQASHLMTTPFSYTTFAKLLRSTNVNPRGCLDAISHLLERKDLNPDPVCLIAEHCSAFLTRCSRGEECMEHLSFIEEYWLILDQMLSKKAIRYFEMPREIIGAVGYTITHTLKQKVRKEEFVLYRVFPRVLGKVRGAPLEDLGRLIDSVVDNSFAHTQGKKVSPDDGEFAHIHYFLDKYRKAMCRRAKGKTIVSSMIKHGLRGLSILLSDKNVPLDCKRLAMEIIEEGVVGEGATNTGKELLNHSSRYTVLYSWIADDAELRSVPALVKHLLEVVCKVMTGKGKEEKHVEEHQTGQKSAPADQSRRGSGKLPLSLEAPIVFLKGLCSSLRRRLGSVDDTDGQRFLFRGIKELFDTAKSLSIYHPSYEGALQKSTMSGLSLSGEVSATFIRVLTTLSEADRRRRVIAPAMHACKTLIKFSFESLEKQVTQICSTLVDLAGRSSNRFEMDQVVSLIVILMSSYRKIRQPQAFVDVLAKHVGHLKGITRHPAFHQVMKNCVCDGRRGCVGDIVKSITDETIKVMEDDDSDDERTTDLTQQKRVLLDAAGLFAIVIEPSTSEQMSEAALYTKRLASFIKSQAVKIGYEALCWIQAAVCWNSQRAGWKASREVLDSVVTSDTWEENVVDSSSLRSKMTTTSLTCLQYVSLARVRAAIAHVAALQAQGAMIEERPEEEACRIAVATVCSASLRLLQNPHCVHTIISTPRDCESEELISLDEDAGVHIFRSIGSVLPLLQLLSLADTEDNDEVRSTVPKYIVLAVVVSALKKYSILKQASFLEMPLIRSNLWLAFTCSLRALLTEEGLESKVFEHKCKNCKAVTDVVKLLSSSERWDVSRFLVGFGIELISVTNLDQCPNMAYWNEIMLEFGESLTSLTEQTNAGPPMQIVLGEYFKEASKHMKCLPRESLSKLVRIAVCLDAETAHSIVFECIQTAISPTRQDNEQWSAMFSLTSTKVQRLLMTTAAVMAMARVLCKRGTTFSKSFPALKILKEHLKLAKLNCQGEDNVIERKIRAATAFLPFLKSRSLLLKSFVDHGSANKITIVASKAREFLKEIMNTCLLITPSSQEDLSQLDHVSAVKEFVSVFSTNILNSSDSFLEREPIASFSTRTIASAIKCLGHKHERYIFYGACSLYDLAHAGNSDICRCLLMALLCELEDCSRIPRVANSTTAVIRGLKAVICGKLFMKSKEVRLRKRSTTHTLLNAKFLVPKCALALLEFILGHVPGNQGNRADGGSSPQWIEVLHDGMVVVAKSSSKPTAYTFETHQIYLALQRMMNIVEVLSDDEFHACGESMIEFCSHVVRGYSDGHGGSSMGVLQSVLFLVQKFLNRGSCVGQKIGEDISRLYSYFAERSARKQRGRKLINRGALQITVEELGKISDPAGRRALTPGIWELMGACDQDDLTEILILLRPNVKETFRLLRQGYLDERYKGVA